MSSFCSESFSRLWLPSPPARATVPKTFASGGLVPPAHKGAINRNSTGRPSGTSRWLPQASTGSPSASLSRSLAHSLPPSLHLPDRPARCPACLYRVWNLWSFSAFEAHCGCWIQRGEELNPRHVEFLGRKKILKKKKAQSFAFIPALRQEMFRKNCTGNKKGWSEPEVDFLLAGTAGNIMIDRRFYYSSIITPLLWDLSMLFFLPWTAVVIPLVCF